jgi:hypothetical protein
VAEVPDFCAVANLGTLVNIGGFVFEVVHGRSSKVREF